ncbi:MAG: Zn-dependent hydrolase of the beta-lactamase fold-like protein [Candidatus Wolfebacteria bacterium GW2011_GWE2_44_13]|uniref:Zn-dependent hydrolase of the beta-lactamase fold-like protein n=1 Tax=Candidatus Wolfebacteria bacterium GW2011_GWE2_44_13 TaxID=1619017 RepID=A0A0G1K5R8_9BACT|nr:MAG: Zn-dependent hydrolase of the beta-lactamase fold-like protein [Candidatus Wolfebacteria bacterium GW2011_GWE2_44_13]
MAGTKSRIFRVFRLILHSILPMVISFYGENSFKIQSGEFTILTDPVDASSGLTPPRFKYDILLKTLISFPPQEAPSEQGVAIYGPGEYNVDGATILGYLSENEVTDKILKTVYLVTLEDIRLCFLGHLAEIPSPSVMEHLEDIDILFIPGGGTPYIDQKKVAKLIKQLQPKIVIPTAFKIAGLKRTSEDLKTFLEELDQKAVESQDKLTIKKKDLSVIKPGQVIILKP